MPLVKITLSRVSVCVPKGDVAALYCPADKRLLFSQRCISCHRVGGRKHLCISSDLLAKVELVMPSSSLMEPLFRPWRAFGMSPALVVQGTRPSKDSTVLYSYFCVCRTQPADMVHVCDSNDRTRALLNHQSCVQSTWSHDIRPSGQSCVIDRNGMGWELGLSVQSAWVQVPALSLRSWTTWGKFITSLGPLFLIWTIVVTSWGYHKDWMISIWSVYFTGLL